ncbi:hypothetical protein LCGC14_1557980 [marine sediment metagenome]|uniref:Uncharacterized protein n=1 Tax=marine sediment metagenome TaxID=412755 RepID=A0A0F9L4Q6_9ZZZZ
MKLKALKEARYTSGSVRVCVDISRELVQGYADRFEDGDFDKTLNHLVELIEQVLGDEDYVESSFDY